MDDIEWHRLGRKRERLRKHGTDNPFCCVCGEHHWTVRYELHHVALRKYDPRTVRLCQPCHDKVTDMLKDYPPIPPGTDPRRAKMIAMMRGRIVLAKLALQFDEELEAWLTGAPPLPELPSPDRGGRDVES
ncbi:MAG: hypothetical protein J7498_11200 [Sphingobium sp.]|nr:hypothetical protein [Sphingobium sp.]